MAITLTAGDFSGILQGYARVGSALGASFGSISAEPFAGFTADSLVTGTTAGYDILTLVGNTTATFLATSFTVNGNTWTIGAGTYNWYARRGCPLTTMAVAQALLNGVGYTADGGSGGPTYAGPTYVGVSTGAGNAAATTIDFTSSGRTSGDLLFIAVMTANQAVTISGWTEVATYSPQSRGTAGAAGGVRLTLFSKVSTGSETTVSTSDSGDIQYAAGLVVRGASGAAVSVDIGAGNNVAATTSGSFGGVTTTGNDRLIGHFVATDRDAAGASWGTPTNANLANLAERFDNGTATGSGGGVAIWTGEKLASGATGNTTSTQAASAAYCWVTLALKNAASGSQTLTPSLFTNSQAFYGPTITRGAVTLAPSLLTNAQTFYAPTVALTQTLAPSLLTNSQSFYAATVTRGAVSLAPTLLTNAQSFYAATIAASHTLTPALLSNSQTFYGPTVTPGAVTISPSLLSNTSTFYAPTVTAPAASLLPPLVTNAQSFFAATITATYTLSPTVLTNAQTFYAPTLFATSSLTPALFANDNEFFTAALTQGGGDLGPDLFINGNIFFAAKVFRGVRGPSREDALAIVGAERNDNLTISSSPRAAAITITGAARSDDVTIAGPARNNDIQVAA